MPLLLLLQNLLIASEQPHNSFPISSSNIFMPASVIQAPQSLSSLRLRFRLLEFFNGHLLVNFNKMAEREVLIMGVQ
jgi:hypothetical protein